jgi:hypothetical protein
MKGLTIVGSVIICLGLAFAPLMASAGSVKSADKVMLNPQPLPPKEKISIFSRFKRVMLNPQPLPPKDLKTDKLKAGY